MRKEAGVIKPMDKPDLVRRIAEMHPQLSTRDAEHTVKVILDALCGTLAKGGRIEIRGFGSFSLNQRPARQKRNPRAGGKLTGPPKYIPQFKPAKELRARACNGAGITEICCTQPIPPDGINHEAASCPECEEIDD